MDSFIKTKKLHVLLLSKISGIFPQSHNLKERLIAQFQFTNVYYFPNFRINSFVPSFKQRDDFRIVFMARIMRQKGIETIFQLADNISHQSKNKNRMSIDFYGPIFDEDKEYFMAQVEKYEMVTYQGILLPDDIYKTLNEYDLMVLPTRFFTEGFPGTILDAYISGIPVVATRWENATEFIDDGITGYIVPFENGENEFVDAVIKLYENRDILLTMKQNAYQKSKLFTSDSAWEILKKHLEN
ncbi:MAG: glycosyltransferase [Mariniphaga sp.]